MAPKYNSTAVSHEIAVERFKVGNSVGFRAHVTCHLRQRSSHERQPQRPIPYETVLNGLDRRVAEGGAYACVVSCPLLVSTPLATPLLCFPCPSLSSRRSPLCWADTPPLKIRWLLSTVVCFSSVWASNFSGLRGYLRAMHRGETFVRVSPGCISAVLNRSSFTYKCVVP